MFELDKINDIDMIEPIRLGRVQMIYQGEDGIIFAIKNSDICMISMTDIDKFKYLYQQYDLKQYQLFNVKQKAIGDVLVNDFQQTLQFACYQAVYNKAQISIPYPPNVCISLLNQEHTIMIKETYQHADDPQYIDRLIDNKRLWGLFVCEKLAGFIGIHDEGSMGLLEILPSYQRCGYGMILESYLINYYLNQGWIPYCQVIEGNEVSLHLQRKLGLDISSKLSYWLFD
ncbi:GNAT family N-acetyltransferase [Candidatus Stoquefichus massiliensis]|uniref:GNAT family N-acetyltransferase n=1 Tax=Candidatus Stoquefichus massiliensis TaxID=1470350 RepID=UPI0004837040|nr:GNAT family N-acetyltransferase [Candidatus Stoquefichus massiliensis]